MARPPRAGARAIRRACALDAGSSGAAATTGAATADVDFVFQRFGLIAHRLQRILHLPGGCGGDDLETAMRGIEGDTCVRVEGAQDGRELARIEVVAGQFELHFACSFETGGVVYRERMGEASPGVLDPCQLETFPAGSVTTR